MPKKADANHAVKTIPLGKEKAGKGFRFKLKCNKCGAVFLKKASAVERGAGKYCSMSCMAEDYASRMSGENNPNYKKSGEAKCGNCLKAYRTYDKRRKYCSPECYVESRSAIVASMRPATMSRKYVAKKDENHGEIKRAFKKAGAGVFDASHVGGGFPDLLVWCQKAWHLVEVKNLKTSYGRKGLSPLQKKCAEQWKGGPVYVVTSLDDVEAMVNGRFSEVFAYGGFKQENVNQPFTAQRKR